MKKRALTVWFSGLLVAAAMAAAVSAPAEVLDNLDFFSDLELLANLEILEDEPLEKSFIAVSTVPAVSITIGAATISTETVKALTFTGRSYEKH
ncbi:MAG TPA: hypothetical protein DCL44_08965 [Elusimicrobia bacterium]|nr:hypothetical protein [Elusimicrobiota bacterium]